MSSGLYPNSVTMWLRPIEYQQEYRIFDAAKWLSRRRRCGQHIALKTILHMRTHRPWDFKTLMSAYYAAVDYETRYIPAGDPNTYRSNSATAYGEDPHMWQH